MESSKEYRDNLIKVIRENVQICQTKFGGRTLLATENEPSVVKIISGLELILNDRLKPIKAGVNLKNINLYSNHFSLRQVTELVSNGVGLVSSMVMGPTVPETPVFWHFIRNHLTRHEQERYYRIQHVQTDYGRGRSWIRSAINEHSLDRYLKMLFSDENLIQNYYESPSLMNNPEARLCLLDSVKDLRSVIFALVVDRKDLDQVDEQKLLLIQSLRPEPEAVKTSRITEPVEDKTKRNKKSKVRVVDLESDEEIKKSTEEISTTFNTVAISIPESGSRPSLLLNHIGSSPSVQSIQSTDSQDVHLLNDSKNSYSLNISEMRQMLLSLTERKNQVEEVKSSLQQELYEAQLENKDLKDRLKISEQQNAEFARENLILKENLKQYMSAVQMLKLKGEGNNTTSTQVPPPDRDQESRHFESKLVQVAEMHGELMEFNSHLQCRLHIVEHFAKRLRTELVHLRGPLPSDYDAIEDEHRSHSKLVSLSSENPLIHIWIPSTFLVEGTSPHHVYQIYIRMGDTEWTIFKRYSQMYKFRKEMKERYAFISTLHFPPKKNFGHREEKTVEERRHKLQDFLRSFINEWIKTEANSVSPNNSSTLDQSDFIRLLPFFSEQRNSSTT